MDQLTNVDDIRTDLLEISAQLDPFEMPLLDAHGAVLAEDVYAGERLVLKSGLKIGSIHIGSAASIGRNSLPTLPQPRVVVISAGADLVEPGSQLRDGEDEFEANSWLLTTAVKEAGAVGAAYMGSWIGQQKGDSLVDHITERTKDLINQN